MVLNYEKWENISQLLEIEKTRIKVDKRGKISKNIGGILNEIFSKNDKNK